MSELSKKFKVKKPKSEKPYYELYIEGDWNDGDYVTKKTKISVEDFEKDDYMLYYLSYLDYDHTSVDYYFRETDEWEELFYSDAEDFYNFLPYGYEQEIHTITELELTYKEDGKTFPVKIPSWKSLFKDDAKKKEKVLAAKKAKEDAEDAEFERFQEHMVEEAKKELEKEGN